MSEYGQVINPQYDPSKNHVYEAFTDYFNDPVLTKIKNVNKYTVYMVRIHAMLGNAYRYLVLFVDRDVNMFGTTKNMKELVWISLQTRTLEDHHDLKSHTYQAQLTPPLNQKITIQNQNEKQSTYYSDTFPLVVTLLHTRKNNSYQYQPTGTIISALETFQTIINFRE
jgi:hypothetical protein